MERGRTCFLILLENTTTEKRKKQLVHFYHYCVSSSCYLVTEQKHGFKPSVRTCFKLFYKNIYIYTAISAAAFLELTQNVLTECYH